MPKMKTRRGCAKRFKMTGSGHLKHRKAYQNHLLTKKSPARKARISGTALLRDEVAEPLLRMIPWA